MSERVDFFRRKKKTEGKKNGNFELVIVVGGLDYLPGETHLPGWINLTITVKMKMTVKRDRKTQTIRVIDKENELKKRRKSK